MHKPAVSNYTIDSDELLLDYAAHIGKWFNSRFFHKDDVKAFKFESDIWLIPQSYHNNKRVRFDFKCLDKVVYPYSNALLLKCFLASILSDGFSECTAKGYYLVIKKFIVETSDFTTILEKNDDEIRFLCTMNGISYIYRIIDYLDFAINNRFMEEHKADFIKWKRKLSLIVQKDNNAQNSRTLPSNRDIELFQYYLHHFKENEKDTDLYNLFYPLIIWWELSIVIPIRPSEITYMMERNCIFESNNIYYIKIHRIKSNLIKKYDIPVMKKICISRELYDLIDKYINLVSYDNKSETLFSIKFLKECFLNVKAKYKDFTFNIQTFTRYYDDYTKFEGVDLYQLLDMFYDYYIGTRKNTSLKIERLRVGDTRHIAFSSLLLQGINPIDIAMIGGHTSLMSLDSYVNHVELYIDSEIYRYYNHIDWDTNTYNKNLKDIITHMPYNSPDNITEATPDEYGIGFCMDTSFQCEDDLCFFCSKWWCRPTNDNYIKAIKYVNKRILNQLKDEMMTNKKILHMIFNKACIEIVDNKLILKEEYYSKYRQTIKAITSNASRIEMIKQSLLINFDIDGGKDTNEQ